MFKRWVDVVLGVLLLLLTLPVLLLAAILVKLDSPGPVFFRQQRVGRGLSSFLILKFRTMQVAAEGPIYTLGKDPRVTRFGHWLRRSKLDELPQLWNVLRGEMSLVGPRPVVPEVVAGFEAEYRELLEMRPGLTDPASIKYCRENDLLALVPCPLRYFNEVATPDKVHISLEYAQRANVWRDLGVILATIMTVADRMVEIPPGAWVRGSGNQQRALER